LSRLREIRGVLLGAPGSAKTRIILHLLQEILAAMYRWPKRNVLIRSRILEFRRYLPRAAYSATPGIQWLICVLSEANAPTHRRVL
jgi:hypothetical protein